jgi:hypothetical protein
MKTKKGVKRNRTIVVIRTAKITRILPKSNHHSVKARNSSCMLLKLGRKVH